MKWKFDMPLPLSLTTVYKPGSGWYRGDFHCHTNQSDGAHPPPELLDVARREGLDFFVITDHNTISAYALFGPARDVLIIPGLEVTYKRGHFNVFGITEDGDWLTQVCGSYVAAPAASDAYPTLSALMRQTASLGLLNSINHPLLAPWAWEFPDAELQHLHCVEIWNDPSWPDNRRDNPRAVDLWTRWLNDGHRIAAVGGSDYHRPKPRLGEIKPAERLGLPSTYVYAENLSGQAILDAVRQRRAYVSMGPQVTFEARHNGSPYGIGADLGEVNGVLELMGTVQECPSPARAVIVKNGQPWAQASVVAGRAEVGLRAARAGEPAWYRLDVYGEDGLMLAMTNPIFVGPARVPERRTFGEFV